MTDATTGEKLPGKEASQKTEEEKDYGVDEGSDSEDESEAGKDAKSPGMDNLTRLRREKRLAMNRESARARRKRKKMLIDTLEQQVSELTRSNEKFKRENGQLVVRVESLSETLAKQEEELVLLRSLASKGANPQLGQQLASPMAASMASAGMVGSVPNLQQQGLGGFETAAEMAADLSLRRLLHTQGLSQASMAMGNQTGVSYGVPPNRAITNQEILGRIGRDTSSHALYGQMLPSRPRPVHPTGIGAALPGQNTVSPRNSSTGSLASLYFPRCSASHVSSTVTAKCSIYSNSRCFAIVPNACAITRVIDGEFRKFQGGTEPALSECTKRSSHGIAFGTAHAGTQTAKRGQQVFPSLTFDAFARLALHAFPLLSTTNQ